MPKEGRKEKDRVIKEGFNQKKTNALSKKALAVVRKQAKKDEKDRKTRSDHLKHLRELRKLEQEEEQSILAEQAIENGADGEENAKEAYRMLQDMRWAYKKVGGRRKLVELAESGDKEFINIVKELMKIESSLMTARIRSKGEEGGNQAVYVVLKGLEAPPVPVSDTIDLKQIQKALTPEGGEYGNKDDVYDRR